MSNPRTAPFSELIEFLGRTQTFTDLAPEQLAMLAQIARSQSYQNREILFHQGDEATGFFIVRSGRVKLFKLSSAGREQILHIFSTGDGFAEVPAFDGQCFPAHAMALEATEVLCFPRQHFLALLERQPTLAIDLLKTFARHLRRLALLVDNLSLREVPGRLAAYLLQQSREMDDVARIELDISKVQLAALLGTVPETLSRALQKLSHDGVIAVEGNVIVLCDRDTLEQLST
ncbi:MAG: Crp/Fnr family transcriptional regulator [Spirulinaceae cyanobacterium SM2_1_0]|nr:Crp/Fnr family transcriptional regulator [Spirulinaceae cyanobacterium SM2_1_0]